MSTDRWMDKEVVHIYKGILLSHEKERIWVSWTEGKQNLEPVIRSEVSQKEKTNIAY